VEEHYLPAWNLLKNFKVKDLLSAFTCDRGDRFGVRICLVEVGLELSWREIRVLEILKQRLDI